MGSRPWSSNMRSDNKPTREEIDAFAREICTKAAARPYDDPARQARHEREQLEWLASISSRHADELRQLQLAEEAEQRDRELDEWVASITTPSWHDRGPKIREHRGTDREQRGVDWPETEAEIRERWDSAKHPRLGGPPNAGWWASTGGAGASQRRSSTIGAGPNSSPNAGSPVRPGSRRQASDDSPLTFASDETPAGVAKQAAISTSFSPAKGPQTLLTGASSSKGHHWVTQGVIKKYGHRMVERAYALLMAGTQSLDLYRHGFDTWNDVTHGDYINALDELIKDYLPKGKRKLTLDEAEEFLKWLANGKCDNASFLAKHKAAFATVFKWRDGFLKSIVIAEEAARLNPKLMPQELKAIAQQFVNGKSTQPLTKSAALVASKIVAGGKAALVVTAKKILPGLMAISLATAAKRGWAGHGHTGEGAWWAANEAAREAMSAELVEKIVFPKVLDTIDGIVDTFVPALNDPTRYHRIWRNGQWIYPDSAEPLK